MANLRYHRYANIFPPMEGLDFTELVASIKTHGLREPVVLFEGKILDGRNRARACAKLRIKPKIRRFDPKREGDPLDYVVDLNLSRRHLNQSQRAMVAADMDRMRQGTRTDLDLRPRGRKSQPERAEKTHSSVRSVRRAEVVRDRAAPEVVAAVRAGHLPVNTAAMMTEAMTHAEQRQVIKATPAPQLAGRALVAAKQAKRKRREIQAAGEIPAGKFGVILEDFEWDDETWSESGRARNAANHYETATDAHTAEQIVARTADRFAYAADDCALYMWTTIQHCAIAFEVMKLRGFTYKSQIAWAKNKISMGRWFRCKHELLLVGTRGTVVAPAPGEQWDSWKIGKVRAHSQKPDWQYRLIEQYHPTALKLELNAGDDAERPGWVRWGAPHRAAA